MYLPESIGKNPFHVLGASSNDSKRRLIDLADEASLLGEEHADDALNTLLHAGKRLAAEANWFPGMDHALVKDVMRYPEQKTPAPFVKTGNAAHMAQLNACRVMLEAWPVTDENSGYALCAAMSLADGAQRADKLLEEINADREKAGFPAYTGLGEMADRLDAVRRETAQRLYERISALPEDQCCKVLVKAVKQYKEKRSPLIEALINEYELRVANRTQALAGQMDEIRDSLEDEKALSERKKKADEVFALLERWSMLTLPMRNLQWVKGYQAKDSQHVYESVLSASCTLNNKHRMTEESLRITRQMQDVFFNLPDAQGLLKKNRQILEDNLSHKV